MNTEVRGAGPADDSAVADLDREARADVAGKRGGQVWLREHPPVDALSPATLVVGTIDGVVVGFLRLEVGPQAAVVERVYVTPEARGLGLGDDLLAFAVEAARRAGSEAIEGQALPGDRETKNLYERAGITARLITLYKRLDAG